MPVGLGRRFLIEAGFLVAVAVGAGFARLGTVTIILVMAGAWLLVAAVEWMIARSRVRTAPEAMVAPAEPLEQRREPPAVRTVPPPPTPVPIPYPAATPPGAERREPEPAPAPEPDVTPGPSLEPTPEPEPGRPPEAVTEPEPRVVAFTPRTLGVPQAWNLWELERLAREQSGTDALRDEERSFLLMYLREFADADGVLPTSFDTIVRESFGDVLDAVGA